MHWMEQEIINQAADRVTRRARWRWYWRWCGSDIRAVVWEDLKRRPYLRMADKRRSRGRGRRRR